MLHLEMIDGSIVFPVQTGQRAKCTCGAVLAARMGFGVIDGRKYNKRPCWYHLGISQCAEYTKRLMQTREKEILPDPVVLNPSDNPLVDKFIAFQDGFRLLFIRDILDMPKIARFTWKTFTILEVDKIGQNIIILYLNRKGTWVYWISSAYHCLFRRDRIVKTNIFLYRNSCLHHVRKLYDVELRDGYYGVVEENLSATVVLDSMIRTHGCIVKVSDHEFDHSFSSRFNFI
jgi:hypothetical protein